MSATPDPAVFRTPKPAHVPDALVVDVDFYDLPGAREDVFRAWRAQHDHWKTLRGGDAPLVWTGRNGGHWIVARGVDLEVLYADAERLSNRSISIPAHGGPKIYPGEADGPDHAAYRGAVMKAFNPRAIRALREPIRAIAERLILAIEPRGECDFVAEFAYRLPIDLFLDMMDLPIADGDYLLGQAHHTIRATTDHEKHAALSAIFAYLAGVVAERRINPGDDLISRMHRTLLHGEPMPQEAVHGICVNILLGGLDTVASMLGFIMKHLAENDADRRRLGGDPGLIETALSEIIRRFPIASLARVVAMDFDYKGIPLKAGERVFLPAALHSFDEERFADAMTLDLDRRVGMIMSFGRGPHQCLGSYLARVELVETLSEWLKRIPDFRVAPDAEVIVASGPINAIKSLPLVWTPTARSH